MNTFYTNDDQPTPIEKDMMWATVSHNMAMAQFGKQPGSGFQWKSFLLGNVASLLLFFSAIGGYTVYKQLSVPQTPSVLKIESAYDQALKQMVAISSVVKEQAGEGQRSAIESRINSIEDIDMMIQEIRNDMLISGSSELKRRQLRRLYATKMDYMKDLLLSGEVDL